MEPFPFKPFLSRPQFVVQQEEGQLFQIPLLYYRLSFNAFFSGEQLCEKAKSHSTDNPQSQQRGSVFTAQPVSLLAGTQAVRSAQVWGSYLPQPTLPGSSWLEEVLALILDSSISVMEVVMGDSDGLWVG